MILRAAPGDAHHGTPRILVPIRRPHARKGRNDIDARRVVNPPCIFLGLRSLLEHSHAVAQPLDRRTRNEHASLQRIFDLTRPARRDGRKKPRLGSDRLIPRIHQKETSRAISVLHLSLLETTLPEQRRLLVPGRTRDGDAPAQHGRIRLPVDETRRTYLRQQALWDLEILQDLLIPAKPVNVI